MTELETLTTMLKKLGPVEVRKVPADSHLRQAFKRVYDLPEDHIYFHLGRSVPTTRDVDTELVHDGVVSFLFDSRGELIDTYCTCY